MSIGFEDKRTGLMCTPSFRVVIERDGMTHTLEQFLFDPEAKTGRWMPLPVVHREQADSSDSRVEQQNGAAALEAVIGG